MGPAYSTRFSFRLLVVLFVLGLSQLFPITARTQNYDFSGVWNFDGFITGPGAPYWERGSLTVALDGTFTGSATQSTGVSSSPSGSFSVSSSGIEMSLNGQSSTSLCMTDSANSIMTCTATLSDTSSNLMILSRQPSSISLSDLAGTWQGSLLASEPNSAWQTVTQTINSDGTFTGSYTKSDGTTGATSGTLSVSPTGKVTCAAGQSTDPTYASYINSTATVMVGTSGGAASSQAANLIVLTRQTTSYSISNLVGVWESSSLASGPGAPWWQNGLLIINPDGSCSLASAASDGTSNNQTGAVSISSSGLVTLNLGSTARGYVDPNMDVLVLTNTWSDGATHQISIFTNAGSAALNGSATLSWSTGDTTAASTPISSSDTTAGSFGGTTGSNPATRPEGAAGGAKNANSSPPKTADAPPPSSGAETGSSPPATPSAGPSPTTAPPSQAERLPKAPSAPGSPTIVLVTPGNSRALVNFKLPASDGGQPITQCTVTANPGAIKISRVGSPIQVSDLKNGTTYTFNVTATNKVGTGPASQTSTSITPGGVPNAPRITGVKTQNAQAQVSFKAPASQGASDPISYTVTSNSGQKAIGTTSPITVKGLSGGRRYTFTVTATNHAGTSPPSAAISVTLP
jgi:hypothetical protein